MKPYLLLLFLFSYGHTFSQENKPEPGSFPWYADIISTIYNIDCKLPANFTDLKSKHIAIYKDENDWKVSSPYFPIIQSMDKECILMYNLLPNYGFMTRNMVIGEIAGMLGVDSCVPAQRDSIHIENYVTITTGKQVHTSFNADSIITIDIPRHTAYMNKYNYCTSMMIIKKARAAMVLKWFFTENGLKNKDKYISSLSNCIEYKNGDWKYDIKENPSVYEKALSQILRVIEVTKADLENK